MNAFEIHAAIKSRLQKLEDDPLGEHLWDGQSIIGDVKAEAALFRWLDAHWKEVAQHVMAAR
jgi:hypothetical protein